MQRLKDKVALITGAARGMGETDARLFASEGASLILTDVDKENLEKLAEEIKSQGTEVLALVQDVASEEDWKKVAAEAEKTFGRVDILVNNAGIVRMEGIEAATKEQWDKIIAVNQTGAWLGMKYTLPLMRQAGGGSIVNINSVYGLIGSGTSVAYHASKGGMRVLSKTAAMEFAKDNIRVNTIFPGGIDDIDLNLAEFTTKVNADLVGKVANLASRTARWLEATGLAARYPDDGGLFAAAAAESDAIAEAYEAGDFARAMRIVMLAADRANAYVDAQEPWKLAKAGPEAAGRLQEVASVALNLFRQLAVYLAPVLPRLAEQAGDLVGGPIRSWSEAARPLAGLPVARFEPLIRRVEAAQIEAVLAASRTEEPVSQSQTSGGKTMDASPQAGSAAPADSAAALAAEPLAAECTIDDFTKVDLRVARIVAAEEVPEARKLLKLTVSLGGDVTRTVFAGIKGFHEPAALVGRLVVVVANLAPRQMKFGLSEGMVVAASGAGAEGVFLLSPDSGALPGMRLR